MNDWTKTILWVILAGTCAGVLGALSGSPVVSSMLGMPAGVITMLWCMDRYDIL